MQLTLLNRPVLASVRPSRRMVTPRASNIADDAANGIVRNFAPASSTMKNLKRPEGSYSGSKHHNKPSGPFADGFDANKAPAKKPAAAKAEEKVEEEKAEGGVMEYLGEAAQALAKKNFPNDKEDPEWMKREPSGYSGNTHRGHGKDGFHAKH